MAVEFVVAAPAFVLLLLLVAAGGQWVSASGEVGAAARDAVRQATLEVSYADVQQAAQSAAQGDLNNLCPGAAQTSVELLAGGQQVGPGRLGERRPGRRGHGLLQRQPARVLGDRHPGQPDVHRRRRRPARPVLGKDRLMDGERGHPERAPEASAEH